MKLPASRQLFAEIEKGTVRNVYLFLGDEDGEKDKAVTAVSGKIFSDHEEAVQASARFYPAGKDTAEFSGAVDFALSSSMFNTRRLCIIRNIENIPVNTATKELARQLIEDRDSSVVLIMTSSERKIPGIFSKDAAQQIYAVQFWRYFENDLVRYIERSLKEYGMAWNREAVSLMVEKTGNDIKKVDEALTMIASAKIKRTITTEDIDFFVADVRETTVFEFINLLFLKDRKAVSFLKKLIDDQEPELKILALISRQAEQLEKCYRLEQGGMSLPAALDSLKLAQKNSESVMRYLQRNTASALPGIYGTIARAERELKDSKASGFLSNPLTVLVDEFLRL